MGTRTASNYDYYYYILCILSQELRHQQILGTAHCSLALLCSTIAFLCTMFLPVIERLYFLAFFPPKPSAIMYKENVRGLIFRLLYYVFA